MQTIMSKQCWKQNSVTEYDSHKLYDNIFRTITLNETFVSPFQNVC